MGIARIGDKGTWLDVLSSLTRPLYLNSSAHPPQKPAYPVPEFSNTVHVGERTCPISKAQTPNPIAQPAIP